MCDNQTYIHRYIICIYLSTIIKRRLGCDTKSRLCTGINMLRGLSRLNKQLKLFNNSVKFGILMITYLEYLTVSNNIRKYSSMIIIITSIIHYTISIINQIRYILNHK